MTVYIEYVFASNFVFDFVLLYCVVKIAKLKVKKRRLFCSVLFGTAIAVILPLFNLGQISSIVAKLCLSAGIVLILGGYKTKKRFFAHLLLFWALTFGMGGVLVCIYFLTEQNFALQSDLSVVSDSPLVFYIAGLLVFGFVAKNVVSYVRCKKNNTAFEYDVELLVGDQRLPAKGFLDSGNQLCDSQTGLPVVIVTSQKLQKFFSEKIAEEFVSKSGVLKNPHYTNFSTLAGGVKKMLVFGVDKVCINKTEYDVLIGLSNQKSAFDCDLLLNAKTFFV